MNETLTNLARLAVYLARAAPLTNGSKIAVDAVALISLGKRYSHYAVCECNADLTENQKAGFAKAGQSLAALATTYNAVVDVTGGAIPVLLIRSQRIPLS